MPRPIRPGGHPVPSTTNRRRVPAGRAVSLWLAGMWLGLLLASWVSATAGFRSVDRVLGPGLRPELDARLTAVAPGDRRLVLRHLASEINRWMFQRWALAQLALSLALLAAAWRGGAPLRAIGVLALAIVVVQSFALAPSIEALGRSIDFLPRPLPPEIGRHFGLLHAGFVGLDLAKAVVLLAAGYLLARRPFP